MQHPPNLLILFSHALNTILGQNPAAHHNLILLLIYCGKEPRCMGWMGTQTDAWGTGISWHIPTFAVLAGPTITSDGAMSAVTPQHLSRTYRSWGAERKMQRLDEICSCHPAPPSSQHRNIAKCRSNLALPGQVLKGSLDRWGFQLSLGDLFPAALPSEMQGGQEELEGLVKLTEPGFLDLA